MLSYTDLSVDECDDILLNGDDLSTEHDEYINIFRNAERRVSARETDYLLTSEISACLETMLQGKVNSLLLSDIETNIRTSLNQSNLLLNNEFDILFKVNEDKVGILLKFKMPNASTSEKNTLSVYIDRLNQRVYR